MKRIAASAAVNSSAPSEGKFRELVERKISADDYVRDLERRASELRTEGAPAPDQEHEHEHEQQ
jgi:hypothetical protein